ncbi:hypothetical protein GA0116948_10383 [Chitinophaga costaii]|uniref:Xylose isomerase-like TIM barrel n=1 Tax=Chitinophaga costaii TaxID=1335309 RepID=A0A1C4BGF2_9BACT|nr:metabolite traffic protein EboE [Chitinophaga costaii]PUZ27620.1 xylose isomerase [Chitinophaga costaii]SCC05923.1 hypothetical protein GA0116948_10383 [Chitinophaga costaii]
MHTSYGHLTYCSNIHRGESWEVHFQQLQKHIPAIKIALSPQAPFGIGLRLSNQASLELLEGENLQKFKAWLKQENCYVFTMNGFPYGDFHEASVKDQVHAPDWSQVDRVEYTLRLFLILADLLPEGMEGGISTSPLSYKHWYPANQWNDVMASATMNIMQVVLQLASVRQNGGPVLHLDIEPEPDGLLEDIAGYIDWYEQNLVPVGISLLMEKFGVDEYTAEKWIKDHVQLCYDICHFAIVYEPPNGVLSLLKTHQLKVGKLQISAALRAPLPEPGPQRNAMVAAFHQFDEPIYLHQVVAKKGETLVHYPDMPQAVKDADNPWVTEWRAHFHVPVFLERYGLLESTQPDIVNMLQLQALVPFTHHLEVETYTWDVLPDELRIDMTEGIIRELQWVKDTFETARRDHSVDQESAVG